MQREQYELHAAIEDRHWWFRGRRTIVRRVLGQLVPRSSQSLVIDVGCGTGANAAALAEDYACIGFDVSSDAIEFARRRFPGVHFVHGAGPDDLDGLVGRARAVLLLDVLEHVSDDRGLLAEWLAVLPRGGLILLTVPADRSLWSPHDESFGHYRRYDPHSLRAAWDGLPVTVRLLCAYNRRLYPAVKLVRTLNRLRGRSSGLAGTDFRIPPGLLNRLAERCFTGESQRLIRTLEGRCPPATGRGVSLMAVLERLEGTVEHEPRRGRPSSDPAGPRPLEKAY